MDKHSVKLSMQLTFSERKVISQILILEINTIVLHSAVIHKLYTYIYPIYGKE